MRGFPVYLAALICFQVALAAPASAQNSSAGEKLYATYCSGCHGDKGKADGPAANSLPVKPADHTNGAVMNRLSDKYLRDIISKGGTAVGKSSFMPGWGSQLTEPQVRDLVAYIRSLANPPYKGQGEK
ncbi:MAG TPA: cytochrome c [Candidatus Eisenbacteria bacterium]|nr:cytochrome c [Candidatus Eisenbacteria bacterium]